MKSFSLPVFLAILLAAGCTHAPVVPAGGVGIIRLFSGWREADSFKRISEYFDGRENTGGQIVLRTHPDQRAGYYFLVRVANRGAARPVHVHVQVFVVGESRARSYDFHSELEPGESVFEVGLTGADWTDPRANPIAWKLDLLDAGGAVLASEKSYVWDKPAAAP